MSRKWIAACLLILGTLILLLSQTVPARAQDPTPENDANCVSCHEHQYYLYDTGKYFCLCEAPMHCVYCHSGRTDSYDKTVAHEGMVLYPTRNHAERCQTCHTEDYMERVVTFDKVAGISSTPIPVITATPMQQAIVIAEAPPPPPLLRLSRLEPWRQIGLGMLGVAMIGLLIFGYRCWRTDCQTRTQV